MFNYLKKSYIRGKIILPLLFISLFVQGCSVQPLIVKATGGIIDGTISALYKETDLEIAKTSMPTFLKLLEGLLEADPGNKSLLLKASEGFTGYSLGFVEDVDEERAIALYLRARDFGLSLLKKNSRFKNITSDNFDIFVSAVENAKREDVPALFWTANAWASYMNLNRDPSAFGDMSKVDAMMTKIIELDETFYFGSAHMYFGVVLAERGIAGGDMVKSKEHFEKCFEISDNKFLLAHLMYAKFYAVRDFDEELFDKMLNIIESTPLDVLPDHALLNAIAKNKGKIEAAKKDDYF